MFKNDFNNSTVDNSKNTPLNHDELDTNSFLSLSQEENAPIHFKSDLKNLSEPEKYHPEPFLNRSNSGILLQRGSSFEGARTTPLSTYHSPMKQILSERGFLNSPSHTHYPISPMFMRSPSSIFSALRRTPTKSSFKSPGKDSNMSYFDESARGQNLELPYTQSPRFHRNLFSSPQLLKSGAQLTNLAADPFSLSQDLTLLKDDASLLLNLKNPGAIAPSFELEGAHIPLNLSLEQSLGQGIDPRLNQGTDLEVDPKLKPRLPSVYSQTSANKRPLERNSTSSAQKKLKLNNNVAINLNTLPSQNKVDKKLAEFMELLEKSIGYHKKTLEYRGKKSPKRYTDLETLLSIEITNRIKSFFNEDYQAFVKNSLSKHPSMQSDQTALYELVNNKLSSIIKRPYSLSLEQLTPLIIKRAVLQAEVNSFLEKFGKSKAQRQAITSYASGQEAQTFSNHEQFNASLLNNQNLGVDMDALQATSSSSSSASLPLTSSLPHANFANTQRRLFTAPSIFSHFDTPVALSGTIQSNLIAEEELEAEGHVMPAQAMSNPLATSPEAIKVTPPSRTNQNTINVNPALLKDKLSDLSILMMQGKKLQAQLSILEKRTPEKEMDLIFVKGLIQLKKEQLESLRVKYNDIVGKTLEKEILQELLKLNSTLYNPNDLQSFRVSIATTMALAKQKLKEVFNRANLSAVEADHLETLFIGWYLDKNILNLLLTLTKGVEFLIRVPSLNNEREESPAASGALPGSNTPHMLFGFQNFTPETPQQANSITSSDGSFDRTTFAPLSFMSPLQNKVPNPYSSVLPMANNNQHLLNNQNLKANALLFSPVSASSNRPL